MVFRLQQFNTRSKRPGGFTLTEIMFAVVVLGIGFIMVAAIFPVAIQQTKTTSEETTAAAIARGGMGYLEQTMTVGLPSTDWRTSAAARPEYEATATLLPPRANLGIPANSSRSFGTVMSFLDDRIENATATGELRRFEIWDTVRQNLILPSDDRYAWVPLYRRDRIFTNTSAGLLASNSASADLTVTDSSYAQVFLIGVETRTTERFDAANDVFVPTNRTLMTHSRALVPNLVYVQVQNGDPADVLTFVNGPTASPDTDAVEEGAAAEGAYVIISDDRLPDTSLAVPTGRFNGRIFRLGAKIGVGQWELIPGYDLRDNSEEIRPGAANAANVTNYATALLVGRRLQDPTAPPSSSNPYVGSAQDIAVYTTFVRLKAQ